MSSFEREREAYLKEKAQAIKTATIYSGSPKISVPKLTTTSSVMDRNKRAQEAIEKTKELLQMWKTGPPAEFYKLAPVPAKPLPSPRAVQNILYEEKMKAIEDQYKKEQAAREKETERQLAILYENKRKAKAAEKAAKAAGKAAEKTAKLTIKLTAQKEKDVSLTAEIKEQFYSGEKNKLIEPYVPIKNRKSDGGFRLPYNEPLF